MEGEERRDFLEMDFHASKLPDLLLGTDTNAGYALRLFTGFVLVGFFFLPSVLLLPASILKNFPFSLSQIKFLVVLFFMLLYLK